MKKILLFSLFLLGAQQAVAMEGSTIYIPEGDSEMLSIFGNDALSWEEKKEQAKDAIQKGANLNTQYSNWNPLFKAVLRMDYDFANWLLSQGANPNKVLSPSHTSSKNLIEGASGFEGWLARQNPDDVAKMKQLFKPGRLTKPHRKQGM